MKNQFLIIMENERKDVGLSKGDWHYRLVRYVWGIEPDVMFKNLCPYFWLTVASIFLFIPSVFVNGLKKIFRTLKEAINNREMKGIDDWSLYLIWVDRTKYDEWREKIWRSGHYVYLEDYLKGIKSKYDTYSLTELMEKRGVSEKDLKKYKDRFYTRFKEMGERKMNQEERSKQANRKLKEKMYAVSEASKAIVIGLSIIAVVGFFYCLCPLLTEVFLLVFSDVLMVKNFWLAMGIIVGAALIIWFLANYVATYVQSDEKSQSRWFYLPILLITWIIIKPLDLILVKFLYGIVLRGIGLGFFEGIVEFTGFFGEYLNSSYSDYCPKINWKEEKK